MKRYLYIIFIVLSLITLSSCSFVNYVKEESSSDETIEQERKNYKYDLESISNDSLYNEEERKLYMEYIVEAKAEINVCYN